MTVTTPGYILEISETSLLINGHAMPFAGSVEVALDLILDQLSQLTLSGSAAGGLGVVLKDNRVNGLGEVTRTIPSGSPVTLAAFAPAPAPEPIPVAPAATDPVHAGVAGLASAGQPVVSHQTDPAAQAPAIVAVPVPAPTVAPVIVASPAATEPAAAMPVVEVQAPLLSPFARLAQAVSPASGETATRPVEAAASPEPPQVREIAAEAPTPLAAPVAAPFAATVAAPAPVEPVLAPSPAPAATTAPRMDAPAPRTPPEPAELSPASLKVVDHGIEGLEPAADEIDYESIFKEDEPIIDEGIRTPIGRSLTARQRTEGFSLKSNARREIERRRERKRRIVFTAVAAVSLIAALRIVGAVMAGPSGDYASVCVDARTTLRLPNATCATNSNPFAQTVYLTVGDRVPAVGGKTAGGTPQKPADPRVINAEVTEGKDGVVLDGGEVK